MVHVRVCRALLALIISTVTWLPLREIVDTNPKLQCSSTKKYRVAPSTKFKFPVAVPVPKGSIASVVPIMSSCIANTCISLESALDGINFPSLPTK